MKMGKRPWNETNSEKEGNHEEQAEWDDRIKRELSDAFRNIPVPDEKQAWHSMQKKLRAEYCRRRFVRTWQIAAAVACLSLVISFTAGGNTPASAFSNLYRMFKAAGDGVVHYFLPKADSTILEGAKIPPPPDLADGGNAPRRLENEDGKIPEGGGVIRPERVTVEEAAEKLNIPLELPGRLPEGFELENTEIYPDAGGGYSRVKMDYRHPEGKTSVFMQSRVPGGYRFSASEVSGTIKRVQIGDYEGVLVIYTEGGVHLEWVAENKLMKIYGDLTEEEVLSFARSVK